MRPTWDEYFVEIATQVATRSTCLRRSVGAVVVRDKRILSTGYNGAPRGLPHCAETGCLRERLGIPSGQRQEVCRGLHAEQNAIIQAALHGVSIEGGSIYVTHQPCITCAKMIINAGITRVVCKSAYPDPLARKMLEEAGVELVLWEQTESVASRQEE
ncbi:MAG: deoxycytidylate deaminase [Anaerolineae bacterium]|jgi:dCMP deaminase